MRQQFCDGEGRDGRHKHHYDTTIHTRHRQRNNHFPETLPTAGAQVLRRLDERVVHLLQRVVYRVNHKGQVVVAEAEEQCSFAQRQTAHIEQFHGGHRTQQEVNPHRQDEQHRHHLGCTEILLRHDVRRRIAHEQTDDCVKDRYHERIQEGLYRLSMGKELREVAQGEVAFDIRERIHTDQNQRQYHEHRHEQDIRPCPRPTRRSYLKYLIHLSIIKFSNFQIFKSSNLSTRICFGLITIPTLSPSSHTSLVLT